MDGLAKLHWRCRRGTLELDALLNNYLVNSYSSAGEGERQLFAQLLELEDSDLLDYLLGDRQPAATQAIILVDKIRSFFTAES
ncbi:MAG: FAD assembly factor SdhE [Gammaproteobacteria bacterium]